MKIVSTQRVLCGIINGTIWNVADSFAISVKYEKYEIIEY